jgi:hypothetical protein
MMYNYIMVLVNYNASFFSGDFTYLLVHNQSDTPSLGKTTHTCYGWVAPNFSLVGTPLVSGNGASFITDGAINVDNKEQGQASVGPRFTDWTIPLFPTPPRTATGPDSNLDLDHDDANPSGGANLNGWFLIRIVSNSEMEGSLLLAKDGVYYSGDSQYNVDLPVQTAVGLTSCIHPDMIVDDLGIPISQVTHFNTDIEYLANLKTGKTNKFINIKKNALGENIPTHDLLLTDGHRIMCDGKETNVTELINNDTIIWVELDKELIVHALKFETRKSIKMHGVDVVQWGKEDFEKAQIDGNIRYIGCGFVRINNPTK